MMNKIIIPFALIFLLACKSENKYTAPEGILNKKKLALVITDLHIADATLFTVNLKEIDKEYKASDFYIQVLDKHNVKRETFEKSIKYYAKHPDEYEKIYDEILALLNKKSGEIIEDIEKNKKEEKEKASQK